jgi:hypothetical protein
MKEKMLNVLGMIACVLAIIGLFKLLQLQDQKNYEYAIERCGSVENLVKHQTQEGDIYWTCLVEKK